MSVTEFEATIDKIVDSVLDPTKLPSELFHYTNLAALDAIARSQRFWHFDADTMWADPAELRSLHSVVRNVERDLRRVVKKRDRALLQKVAAWYTEVEVRKLALVYLACFTAEPDSGPHWAKFGPKEGADGLCVGFKVLDREAAPEPITGVDRGIMRVLYDEEECRALLREHFQRVLDEYAPFEPPPSEARPLKGFICSALFRVAAKYAIRLKKPEFADEKELRSVAIVPRRYKDEVASLRGTYDSRDYLPLPMVKPELRMAFSRIILDPRVGDVGAQAERVRGVLLAAGYPPEEVPDIVGSNAAR